MVQQIKPPIGYVSLYDSKEKALAVRDKLRISGNLAEAFGPASKVSIAEDYGDGDANFTSKPADSCFVVVATMIRLT